MHTSVRCVCLCYYCKYTTRKANPQPAQVPLLPFNNWKWVELCKTPEGPQIFSLNCNSIFLFQSTQRYVLVRLGTSIIATNCDVYSLYYIEIGFEKTFSTEKERPGKWLISLYLRNWREELAECFIIRSSYFMNLNSEMWKKSQVFKIH